MKNQIGQIMIGVGIALAGYFIYSGIDDIVDRNRIVSARGLSERVVMADKAVWTIAYSVSGNQIESLYDKIEPKKDAVVKFLRDNGIADSCIVMQPSVYRNRQGDWDWKDIRTFTDQYVLKGHLTVVSSEVEKVRQLQLHQLDLVNMGVMLDESHVSYEYMGLNDLKPEMVEEATRNARIVAEKFASDAGCGIGTIQTAHQGQFEIDSDDVLPHLRKIRVVTTISYYLK